MKEIAIFCYLFLLIATGLCAQEADTREKATTKGRSAWIITTDIPEGIGNPVTLLSGETYKEFILSKREPTEAVQIPADGLIQILQKTQNPENPSYSKLAEIRIDKQIQNVLIILVPVIKDPEKPVFEAKLQDLSTFKKGDWLFVNTSKFSVSVETDHEKLSMDPDQSKIWAASASGPTTKLSMRYRPDGKEADTWKLISSSSVAIYDTRREICILSWSERHSRMDFNGFTLTAP